MEPPPLAPPRVAFPVQGLADVEPLEPPSLALRRVAEARAMRVRFPRRHGAVGGVPEARKPWQSLHASTAAPWMLQWHIHAPGSVARHGTQMPECHGTSPWHVGHATRPGASAARG